MKVTVFQAAKILLIFGWVLATGSLGASGTKEVVKPISLAGAQEWTLIANPQLLVSAADLRANLDKPGVLILDARAKGDYDRGHIPGSVLVLRTDLEDVIKVEGQEYSDLKKPAEVLVPLRKAGVSDNSKILIVGDASSVGPRLFWVLDYLGHQNVAVLDGGYAAWKALGGKESTEANLPAPGNFTPKPVATRVADYAYVKASIGNNAVILCNALAEASHNKEAIVGSINLPQTTFKVEGAVPYFKGAEELKSLLQSVGYTAEKELVFYCGGGGAASVDYLAARLLGVPKARVYDGSVAEWKAKGEILPPGGVAKNSSSPFSLASAPLDLKVNKGFLLAQADLAALLKDPKVVLIDARTADEYAKGFLPGAVNIDPRKELDKSIKLANGNEVAALVKDEKEIVGPLQAAGISQESRVVVYDGGTGYLAARIFWVLDYYGHQNVAVLDGGIKGFTDRGGVLSQVVKTPTVGNFVPVAQPAKIADYDYVKKVLGTDATLVCDALAKETFAAGAIPGAVNLPYTATYDVSSNLKSAQDLYDLLTQVGYNPTKERVFYCGAGYAASQNYFIARYLGVPQVRNYDGSKRDWTAHGDKLTPSGAKS